MAYRIKVSRSGLTRCPGCQSHVRLEADASRTECPFCGVALVAALADDPSSPGAVAGILKAGRGGALAAALLGAAVPACGSEDEEPAADASADADVSEDVVQDVSEDVAPEVTPDVVEDTPPADVYGLPPDVQVDAVEDAPPVDLYGMVPDTGDDVEADIVDDATPAPEYGLPADVGIDAE